MQGTCRFHISCELLVINLSVPLNNLHAHFFIYFDKRLTDCTLLLHITLRNKQLLFNGIKIALRYFLDNAMLQTVQIHALN